MGRAAFATIELAIDKDGFVHMIGWEEFSEDAYQLVHWFVGTDSVERTVLAPLPRDPSDSRFEVDDSGELHFVFRVWDELYDASGHGANDWTTILIEDPDADQEHSIEYPKLAVGPDGTAWMTWRAGDYSPLDPLRVASVVDGVIAYEVVDDDAVEATSALAVDPMGRPWLVYTPEVTTPGYIKIAHKEADQWIIEQMPVPP